MTGRAAALGIAATLAAAAPAVAEVPALSLPIDCHLGSNCYIEDYVDADPGPGQRDYACGLKSRDDHRGTDFMLPSFKAMRAGVHVLSAAPGIVAATRDGMADAPVTPETHDDIRGLECGNAVRINHGAGLATLYFHLKRGSLRVREGDRVARGHILGEVGLSGLTNAPHLHLGALQDGKIVDPFRPVADATCRDDPGAGLWQSEIAYSPTGLFTAGFSADVPSFEAVKSGAARMSELRPDQPIVLYGHAFHAEPKDRLIFKATGPEGEVFRRDIALDAPKAQLFRAFGRRAPDGGWRAGRYRGYVRLMRGTILIAARHADATVTASR